MGAAGAALVNKERGALKRHLSILEETLEQALNQ